MLIRRLEITGVRNLSRACLENLSPINILFGDNGAGKTSVLESIYLLSSARSFRGHKLKPLVNIDMDSCVSFAEIDIEGLGYQPVGIKRFKASAKPGVIKVAGQHVKSASVLAENLPLQVINADTFQLLEGSPSVRRQFLDWGVFHVEHQFYSVWKSAQRCLKQRNSLLRHARIDQPQLAVWTSELVQHAELIHGYRAAYFTQLVPVFEKVLDRLIDLDGLQLAYFRGWDKDRTFTEVLASNQQREQEQGYTLSGPHRADLKLRYRASNAADILSRGQQKLVVCALRVAQGYLLSQLTGKSCVFLVDDLPAELDFRHRKALCGLFEELQCQVFVTCVDHNDLVGCWGDDTSISMFHVEQGKISEVVAGGFAPAP
ncbi:DNA replication/repair protein RecF [Oceanicoccus sp. KOV_DT_Chl]|uniref:DNA replication/repair protein RecF n=1 Tax=Oceanicoccus sp. KOV_DT_Chl TaxID=1904639 RepID=UPI000C7A425F|nr:DNA replication/repair protein RecF [Oceanicoccus sp. KOV_DT_Chl]